MHQPLSRTLSEFENVDAYVPFNFTQDQLEFFEDPNIDKEILERALKERSGRPVLLNPPKI